MYYTQTDPLENYRNPSANSKLNEPKFEAGTHFNARPTCAVSLRLNISLLGQPFLKKQSQMSCRTRIDALSLVYTQKKGACFCRALRIRSFAQVRSMYIYFRSKFASVGRMLSSNRLSVREFLTYAHTDHIGMLFPYSPTFSV